MALHEDYENWWFGRIPYLEHVIKCTLPKANCILRILRRHAADLKLKLSHTVYMKWGKGQKARLRFSKSANPTIDELYSTHYVRRSSRDQLE